MPRVESSVCRKCWNCGDVAAEYLPDYWHCPDKFRESSYYILCVISEIPKWCPYMLEHAVVASVNIDTKGGDDAL
jgi:hypothetical protein